MPNPCLVAIALATSSVVGEGWVALFAVLRDQMPGPAARAAAAGGGVAARAAAPRAHVLAVAGGLRAAENVRGRVQVLRVALQWAPRSQARLQSSLSRTAWSTISAQPMPSTTSASKNEEKKSSPIAKVCSCILFASPNSPLRVARASAGCRFPPRVLVLKPVGPKYYPSSTRRLALAARPAVYVSRVHLGFTQLRTCGFG
jgi:hypothetical protein